MLNVHLAIVFDSMAEKFTVVITSAKNSLECACVDHHLTIAIMVPYQIRTFKFTQANPSNDSVSDSAQMEVLI